MRISEINSLAQLDCSLSPLEQGIVTASNTVISLLGLDLIGIRTIKIVTTIDTWLKRCAELFF